jgi:proteasome lid subunit RPN8/RPN11
MRVRIFPLALGKIVKHAASSIHKEVAGLLIGKSSGHLEIWDAGL